MFGVWLIALLIIVGGFIAFLGDKLGSKIGKKRISIFGLRPYHTSVLMTVISGVVIAALTMGILTVSSQDARTALFGMDQLRSEVEQLSTEKQSMEQQLEQAQKAIQEAEEATKSATAAKTQAQAAQTQAWNSLQAAKRDLGRAQGQLGGVKKQLGIAQGKVTDLETTKQQLGQEVQELETATKKLRQGLTNVRIGDVAFRSGQVLFEGVLQGGQKEATNSAQLEGFLNAANNHLAKQMGVKPGTQVLWLSNKLVSESKLTLGAKKGEMFVRLRAMANILTGEMILANIEMQPNVKVFNDKNILSKQEFILSGSIKQKEQAIYKVLQEVNAFAVKQGVQPDPITGKVGKMTAEELNEIIQEIPAKGIVELVARAKGDIYTAGPVLLNIEVRTKGSH